MTFRKILIIQLLINKLNQAFLKTQFKIRIHRHQKKPDI